MTDPKPEGAVLNDMLETLVKSGSISRGDAIQMVQERLGMAHDKLKEDAEAFEKLRTTAKSLSIGDLMARIKQQAEARLGPLVAEVDVARATTNEVCLVFADAQRRQARVEVSRQFLVEGGRMATGLGAIVFAFANSVVGQIEALRRKEMTEMPVGPTLAMPTDENPFDATDWS